MPRLLLAAHGPNDRRGLRRSRRVSRLRLSLAPERTASVESAQGSGPIARFRLTVPTLARVQPDRASSASSHLPSGGTLLGQRATAIRMMPVSVFRNNGSPCRCLCGRLPPSALNGPLKSSAPFANKFVVRAFAPYGVPSQPCRRSGSECFVPRCGMSPKRIPFTIPATPPAVLVADADADTRALYRYAFEADGYRVVEACDGCEALSKALAERPAVIVTETTLAYVDGMHCVRFCVAIRSRMGYRSWWSRRRRGPFMINGREKPAPLPVLVKPVDTAVIVTELQRVLDDSSADRPANTAELGRTHVAHRSRAGRHLSKSFARATTITPQAAAIALRCPGCDRPLTYERSHFGGVNASHAEQWDDYSCERCGPFKFRHRTRKLTRIAP